MNIIDYTGELKDDGITYKETNITTYVQQADINILVQGPYLQTIKMYDPATQTL